MFLYYVLTLWPILRLCVILNEVISPELGIVRACKLCSYRVRNYFEVSSNMYKFVPVLGVKNKKLHLN